MEGVIQVAGAFLAIYAFSVANDAPKKYLVYCGLTGAFGWAVYLIALPGCGWFCQLFGGRSHCPGIPYFSQSV